MTTTKQVLLSSLLVTLVVATVAVAAASAADNCTMLANSWCFVIELPAGAGELLLTASAGFVAVKDAGTKSELEIEGLAKVECEKAENTGTFDNGEAPQIVKLVMTFSGACHVVGSPGCTVKEPIASKAIVGTFSLTGQVTFKPETGTEFATVRIEGSSCEVAATIKVTGEQGCESSDYEVDAVAHLYVCTEAKSRLKDGAKAAFVEIDQTYHLIEPNAGDLWAYHFELF